MAKGRILEISLEISNRTGIKRRVIQEVLENYFQCVMEHLIEGESVRAPRLGYFFQKKLKPTTIYNTFGSDGRPMHVGDRVAVGFRPQPWITAYLTECNTDADDHKEDTILNVEE